MRRHAPVAFLSITVPALLALPVATPPAPQPEPVRPDVVSLPASGVDEAALQQDDDRAGGRPFVLTAKRSTDEFAMLGVTWAQDSGTGDVTVRVRTRTDDRWSDWTDLEMAADDGPDDVSAETRAPRLRLGTAPTWVGDADGVQARIDVASGPAPQDVRIDLIDPGSSPADASLGATAPASTATAATARPQIITRAQWGADERMRTAAPSYSSTIKAAYVHHTASTNNYTAEQAAGQVRGFYAYHTRSLGWSDIGYNFLVDKFGRIYEGRFGGVDRPVIGAHAGGFNSGTMGVSMIGTHTSVAPTSATTAGVRDLLAWKLSLHGRDPQGTTVLTSGGGSSSRYPAGTNVRVNVIAGHRETNSTACPGDAAYSRLPALRRAVADRTASSSTTSPVESKYASLGGSAGFLGSATSPEGPAAGGLYRHYQAGSIYWSSATGAREVHGAVVQRWAGMGWERGPLGYPTTDETGTPDGRGRFNHFQNGSIYWSPSTGAQDVYGAIRSAWSASGWELGPLGYPTTGETAAPDGVGRYNDFQKGSVYWSERTGAHDVRGPLLTAWRGLGAQSSALGYPVTGERTTPDQAGRYNHFERGSVYWTAATGAREVRGGIKQAWASLGSERGPLGYPVTNELGTPDGVGRFSEFQNGSVYWTRGTGAHEVRGAIRDRWSELGWERSRLGYPTSDEYDVPGGRRGDFQGGSITWSAITGATTVAYR